jgi:hypothetical protein
MRTATAAVFLLACSDGNLNPTHGEYVLVGEVPLDEPWRDGPSPAELASSLTAVPGEWVVAQTPGPLPLAFAASVSGASEYECISVHADGTPSENPCAWPDALFFVAEVSLSNAGAIWAGATDRLLWDGVQWGFHDQTHPIPEVILRGPAPDGIDTSGACSQELGLQVWRSLDLLDTSLVALCPDGAQEILTQGTWSPIP